MRKVEPIPPDHPVQPLRLKQHRLAIRPATCGHCDLSWDDGKSTSITPTPGGRCPFECFHIHPDDED